MSINDPTPVNFTGWMCCENVVPSDSVTFAPSWIEVLVAGTFKIKNDGSGADVVITVAEGMVPYIVKSRATMFYNTGSDAAYDALGTVNRYYNR